MLCIGQITTNLSPLVVQVVIVAAGCLLLYVAVKIGYVILKVVLGLAALALLGGAIWWFLSAVNH
jgi:uncharacterized membrane protein YGL010W